MPTKKKNYDEIIPNIDIGESGSAGTLDIFPSTVSKGKLSVSCDDQTGNTAVELKANEMGQATEINIPDPGQATAYVVLSDAALTAAEVGVLAGVTPGTVAPNKAVVVDPNKDISAFRNLNAVNVDAGASGTAGSVDVFPSTASKGKLSVSCDDQTGNTAVGLKVNEMGQATDINIPDPGIAASYVAQSTAALTVLEVDRLDGATAGTQVANKVVVADVNINTGVAKITQLQIGTSGSETPVTATADELNYCDVAAAGTAEASKALIVDGSKDIAGINKISCVGLDTSYVDYSTAAELTIATGVITVTQSAHTVDGEGDADDDLDTINGFGTVNLIYLRPENSARNITLKHGTGNIITSNGSDYTIPDNGAVTMWYDGSNWRLVGGGGQAGLDWDNIISGATTAKKDNGYLVDCSGGVVTLTLPAAPATGATVGVVDYTGSAATNTITVARNGLNIFGEADDIEITTNNTGFTLVYTDTTEGWVISTEISSASGVSVITTSPVSFIVAISDETTDLTTGAAKITFRMPHAMTLTDVRASVTTAPTDATLTIDINESGSTILSTKLTIDSTEKTSTTAAVPVVISDSALADDAEITIDIDQIGSSVAGAGAKITFLGTRS